MKTTKDGRAARKCRADCIDAKPHTECNCNCVRACHGQGACDPERHRFDGRGGLRW